MPGVLSKSAMKKMGMVLDLGRSRLDIRTLGITNVPFYNTKSGHPTICIVDYPESVDRKGYPKVHYVAATYDFDADEEEGTLRRSHSATRRNRSLRRSSTPAATALSSATSGTGIA